MRIKEFFLSYFDDAESTIKDKYLEELKELNQKVILAWESENIYEKSLIFICAVYEKSFMFEDIKKILNKANYSQHDKIIKSIDGIIGSIGHIREKCLISADCKAQKREPKLSDIYINIGFGMNENLLTQSKEDKRSWNCNHLDPRSNGYKIKKIISNEVNSTVNRLQRIISYIN